MVLTEAQACGTAVIGSRVGGSEALRDGATGLLVAPDDVSALSEALLRLLSDPSARRRFGQAGHAWVHRDLAWKVLAARPLPCIGPCCPGELNCPRCTLARPGFCGHDRAPVPRSVWHERSVSRSVANLRGLRARRMCRHHGWPKCASQWRLSFTEETTAHSAVFRNAHLPARASADPFCLFRTGL